MRKGRVRGQNSTALLKPMVRSQWSAAKACQSKAANCSAMVSRQEMSGKLLPVPEHSAKLALDCRQLLSIIKLLHIACSEPGEFRKLEISFRQRNVERSQPKAWQVATCDLEGSSFLFALNQLADKTLRRSSPILRLARRTGAATRGLASCEKAKGQATSKTQEDAHEASKSFAGVCLASRDDRKTKTDRRAARAPRARRRQQRRLRVQRKDALRALISSGSEPASRFADTFLPKQTHRYLHTELDESNKRAARSR